MRVVNGRGEIFLPAVETAGLRGAEPGCPCTGAAALSSPGANALMPAACDPLSAQPELKHAATQVEKADLPYPSPSSAAAPTSRPPWLCRNAPAPCSMPFLRRPGPLRPIQPLVVFRAATTWPLPEAGSLAAIDHLFGPTARRRHRLR